MHKLRLQMYFNGYEFFVSVCSFGNNQISGRIGWNASQTTGCVKVAITVCKKWL